jgi:hypothetical protein
VGLQAPLPIVVVVIAPDLDHPVRVMNPPTVNAMMRTFCFFAHPYKVKNLWYLLDRDSARIVEDARLQVLV